MNVVHHHALRLIAFGLIALAVATPVSASRAEQPREFKLAMGPMSATQRNQGPGMAEQSGQDEVKPHHRTKTHHHHVKHRKPHRGQ